MASGGFNKHSGPAFPSPPQTQFGNSPRPSPPISPFNNNSSSQRSPRLDTGAGFFFNSGGSEASQRRESHPLTLGRNISNSVFYNPFEESQRPTVSPPRQGSAPKSYSGDSSYQTHQGPSSDAPYVLSLNAATHTPARPSNFQGLRWTRSPPFANKVYLNNFTQDVPGRGRGAPQRMQSPPQANGEDLRPPLGEAHRWPSEASNFQAPKKARSPPIQSANGLNWRNSNPSQGDSDRAVASPPRFGNTSTSSANNSSRVQQWSSFSSHNEAEGAGSRTTSSHVPKRNRSPSLASDEVHLSGTSYSAQDDSEREMQAKAKRLARFGVELSQPVQSNVDQIKHKFPANRHDQALVEKRKLLADQPIEAAGDFMQSDYDGVESSSVIIGICPDMCPGSEREERERKGDLDKYERFDGDRNQTSISLAVKKYNRTAERVADLIRPMPVLQLTIDYLLALLDQPYDDRFLGMYNFLWDRMRAIRMDLRMQHIFTEDAITMLEQMIRLHVIAMHELCEYTKGEGFSEGFDAHLNIEQMNKTSVELFQMYDDHRKKGSTVESEKEFRGYYALLKLDKHPGYKVEPAELSLDLAKMTPEIRQTPEILFARDVARACRTGNFIAFFRLARKATYLQACLMHAHFAKLRTQALASLHSGLQSNQGIPIALVTKWLGMEAEDIESLLEYHGFSIKEFEELYMVKEGLFLNSDKDYPTKCSRLVHLKKSRRIVKDVSSSNQLMWPIEDSKEFVSDTKVKPESKVKPFVKSRPSIDEVMLTFEEDPAIMDCSQVQSIPEISLIGPTVKSDYQVADVWQISSFQQSPQSAAGKVVKMGEPARETLRSDSLERTLRSSAQGIPLKPVTEISQQSERSEGSSFGSWVENYAPQIAIRPEENDETLTEYEALEEEEAMIDDHDFNSEKDMMIVHQDNEVATVKLKLILRKWKRFSLKRKELREQRQLVANAALSSLTLGPPIQQIRAPWSHVGELDIDRALRERRERHQKSWSRMNTSEVVGEILRERNPDAKCLCWKLLVCSQPNITEGVQRNQTDLLANLWLHSKLMGARKDDDDELVVSSQNVSIWKKWVTREHNISPICCLSVVRDGESEDDAGGVGGILFLVSESIPLDVQKAQLHNLLTLVPSVPLLILRGTKKEASSGSTTIVNGLGLHDVDKTRISSFSMGSLVDEHSDGFFSTENLRKGLKWLASQSPIQPMVHCVKTRNLVMNHLSCSLAVLENTEVGPNDCISAFNEALDRTATEVATAAETNPSGWPCLEIALLESIDVNSVLPSVGWSSDVKINPTLTRIQGCKLPSFPDDLSWLNNGSDMGEEILRHKLELEKSLIRYLTDLSKMMDETLATTEASVIIQKGAFLELQDSIYRIIPKWVAIFRRIFNWHLMSLSGGGVDSTAYVLENRSNVVTPWFGLGDSCQLSLDEMVGVWYNTQLIPEAKAEAIQPLFSREVNHGKETLDEENAEQEVESTTTEGEAVFANKGTKEADTLSKLLEQCNIVQNRIDEKLSFYF